MQRTKIISILLLSTALAGGCSQKSGSKIIQKDSDMVAKLFKTSTLHMFAEYADFRTSLKARLVHKKYNKLKVSEKMDVFPNDGRVRLIFDTITNEFTWEDKTHLIPQNMKQEIVSAMKLKGKEMSNELFDALYEWLHDPITRMQNYTVICPFLKDVLLEMATNVEIGRHGTGNLTPLMLAAAYDADKAVAKLIERGVKTNIRNASGETALHYCAKQNSLLSCKMLLEKGAYVNAQDWGVAETSLMIAANLNHIDMVKLLLKHGATTAITRTNGLGDVFSQYYSLTPECSRILKKHREEHDNKPGCIIL